VKNLLASTAFLAAGFLLGSRRARKAGPIDQLCIEVKADTTQAVEALKRLEAQYVKTYSAQAKLPLCGADLVAVCEGQDYRVRRSVEPGRATGQTTRQIDAAIQTLFTTGEVVVRDHVDRLANHRMVYDKVVARLKLEHRREDFVCLDHKLKVILPKYANRRTA
jgi:hypothetical protein